jgi:hypothetical protein
MDKKEAIMIIGAPRSGTTLLSGLITGNEKCYPNLPECTFITQIIKHYFDIVNYSDKERFSIYAKDKETLFSVYSSHVNNMLKIVLNNFEGPDYKYLVLKDPEVSLYIDLIPRFIPQSKVIYIVRDPRYVVSSMLKVFVKKGLFYSEHDGYYSDVNVTKVASDIYNYYHTIHESCLFKSGGVYVVKYEKLIEGLKSELAGLESYLGYELSGSAFERNSFEFDNADPTFSKNYGSNIVKPASDYHESISSSQIEDIESMFSGLNLLYEWWG